MIDIHCHPLPGVDDGPEAFEMSVAMGKMAAADGVTHLVATPHCNYRYLFDPEVNRAKVRELEAAIGDAPQLLLGCDFHLSYENIQQLVDAGGRRFTINQTAYLLVELDEHFVPQQFDQVFYQIQVAGFTPILTHPERNPVCARRPELLSSWVARGCLVQVTAQSYTGGFGEAAQHLAEVWLEHNLVHFFASDAHDDTHRPPLLSPCYDKLARSRGKAAADRLLVNNQQAVINGQQLPPGPEPREFSEVQPKRSWFSFLRR
jgi:protein-tyrosine phosphatase